MADDYENNTAGMISASAPDMNPASTRGHYSFRFKNNAWQYGDDDQWFEGDIQVTCLTNNEDVAQVNEENKENEIDLDEGEILLKSTGGAAEYQGSQLGLYTNWWMNMDITMLLYTEWCMMTLKQGPFIYCGGYGNWYVNDEIGPSIDYLRNTNNAGQYWPMIPSTGWEYADGNDGWMLDPEFKVKKHYN